jgi:hypothetical protein
VSSPVALHKRKRRAPDQHLSNAGIVTPKDTAQPTSDAVLKGVRHNGSLHNAAEEVGHIFERLPVGVNLLNHSIRGQFVS